MLATHRYRDLAADRAVFDGVADQIVDRLPHPVGVAHGDEIRRPRYCDGLLLVCGQRLIGVGNFADQACDIDRLAANGDVEGVGHCDESLRLACIRARVRWATRSSSWVLASCSC